MSIQTRSLCPSTEPREDTGHGSPPHETHFPLQSSCKGGGGKSEGQAGGQVCPDLSGWRGPAEPGILDAQWASHQSKKGGACENRHVTYTTSDLQSSGVRQDSGRTHSCAPRCDQHSRPWLTACGKCSFAKNSRWKRDCFPSFIHRLRPVPFQSFKLGGVGNVRSTGHKTHKIHTSSHQPHHIGLTKQSTLMFKWIILHGPRMML